jgi:TetR/AcrR family transcriptional repressor of lmrAB and yxaGH operons
MKQQPTRERFIRATAALLQERGYAATGLRDILAASGAPRGSMYFHFPGGKAELATEAIRQSGKDFCEGIRAILDAAPSIKVAITTICRYLSQQLTASHYKLGCPVAPLALEETEVQVKGAVAGALESWQEQIQRRLVSAGFTPSRATELAMFTMSVIEGALLLSKAHQSVAPLERAEIELVRMTEMEESK